MSASDDATRPAAPDIDGWLERLREVLPPGALDEIGPAERAALLDLARIAAHQSHRSAAPITTYVVGLTVAARPRAERLAAMRALITTLDRAS